MKNLQDFKKLQGLPNHLCINHNILINMIQEGFPIIPIPYTKGNAMLTSIEDNIKKMNTTDIFHKGSFAKIFNSSDVATIVQTIKNFDQNSYFTYCYLPIAQADQLVLKQLDIISNSMNYSSNKRSKLIIIPVIEVNQIDSLTTPQVNMCSVLFDDFEDICSCKHITSDSLYNTTSLNIHTSFTVQKNRKIKLPVQQIASDLVLGYGQTIHPSVCSHDKTFENNAGGTKFKQCSYCKTDLGNI